MFAWSDPHFWHTNVIKNSNRPFTDVEEMNEALIQNYNSVVGKNDTCLWFGDSLFCGVEKAKAILSRLNGNRSLILGNHDWRQKYLKQRRAAEFGFTEIGGNSSMEIAGQKVMLSHFPYWGGGDKTEVDRYEDARLKDEGLWLLHGHVHRAWKVRGRQINVGVDVWDYKPVHIDEIAKLIRNS